MPTQNEIRQTITDQIIEALTKGCAPWRRPWTTDNNAGAPANAVTRKSYSGVNPLLLQIAAIRHGFSSRYWATYRQWSELGCQVKSRPNGVRPGEWGTSIVFCKPCKKTTTDADGKEIADQYFLLRTFAVFSADQVLHAERFQVGSEPISPPEVEQRFEKADEVVKATGAEIRYGGDAAFYSPDGDFIQLPHRHQFAIPEFYDTLFHELSHWTEHADRLNWDRKKPENTYALGELTAELGACYLAGELNLPLGETLPNHAAYLQNWLMQMQGDTRFIFRAAAQASKATDFILSFSRTEVPEPEPELVG